MEQTYKRRYYSDGHLAAGSRDSRDIVWMASAGQYTKLSERPNIKMKAFLSFVTICVFCFSSMAGAAFRTIADGEVQRATVVKLINMPVRELAEYRI